MKKYLALLLSVISLTTFSQSQPAPKTGGVALRVNDSTAYISTQTTAHSQGYADIFWNNQATTPHYDIWNGSSYDHVFDFNAGGGGGTQDLQSVLDEGSTATLATNIDITLTSGATKTVTSQDATHYGQLLIGSQSSSVSSSNNANTQGASFEVNTDGIKVSDNYSGSSRGIQGTANFSSNIQANDFTQKNYVDAGLATKEGTLSNSAGLRAALSDESGTGNAYFQNGDLGTPSAGVLTNATGYTFSNIASKPTTLSGYGITDAATEYLTANNQTTNYTLVLTDADTKMVEMNSASANTVTIPPNSDVAFPVGTIISVVQQGAGNTSMVAGSGVTIRSQSGVLTSPGQYSPMVIQKRATNEWYLWNGTSAITASEGLSISGGNITLGGPSTTNKNISGTSLLGLGITPTAVLHLRAGTGTANTAPLKFTSGTLNTTAEAGAMEFLTDDLFFTISTGAARKGVILDNGNRLTSGRVPFATTNGRLIDQSGFSFASSILTVPNLINSGLTSGRVTFATTSGQLTDDSGFTFSGTNDLLTTRLTPTAGTTSANTAPIRYTSGSLLTTIEAGASEFNGAHYTTTTALNRVGIGGPIADFTADVNNSGTSETDIQTYTTKASTLGATGEKLTFDYTMTLNDATATAQIKVLFAGTSIGDTGALTVNSTGVVVIRGWIVRTGASTARASVNISSPTTSSTVYTAETDLTGLTFTNTNILKTTATAGGGGGGSSDITGKIGCIYWWPAAAN